MHSDVVIIIPSRIGSCRLANKALKPIGPYSMIEHVVNQVKKTGLANIYVATDSELIAEKVLSCGAKYILTDPALPSGTDRVYAAFMQMPGHEKINYVINVQGDMPFVEPEAIMSVIEHLKKSSYEIMTPVTTVSKDIAEITSNVKVIADINDKALYFSRSLIPYGAEEFLYHIGIYGFRSSALTKFVELEATRAGISENLEQLKALQNGINIGICHVDNIPISVDTQEDLDKAIEFYHAKSQP